MIAVVRDYSDNEMNINAIERIRQYQNIEQDADLKANHENKPPAAWPSKGDVQIEDLVVEYVPGVPVLRGISLSVKHGENVGVVGRTGAGKSTISLALMRFIEASKGRIVMDGVDISKIGLEDLRRNVTIIPQDPVLFNGTIRFNLDPFDEHPDELLWDALRRTHLAREDDTQPNSSATSVIEIASSIDSNEHGVERMAGIFTSLDTKIKENGKSLSSGQRQLMALARALVRRSKVIIMDEATASVDFDTDNRIQRAIHGPEFANSTLFCIAHRLRTIVDYDKVLVLENGKVAEFDTPHNLLQNKTHVLAFSSVDSRRAVCDGTTWAWSLESDCFRNGFLWPALLLLASGLAALAFFLCLAFPPKPSSRFATNGDAPLGRLGVGARKRPVRRPPGPVTLVDNRIGAGLVVLVALAVQTGLYAAWWANSRFFGVLSSEDLLYPDALAKSATMVLLFSAVSLSALSNSNRLAYIGLFPWVLPALVVLQLLIGVSEIYASFFTDVNLSVPIVGSRASFRSNALVASTVFSFVLLVFFSLVQQRPLYLRPVVAGDSSTLPSSSSSFIREDPEDREGGVEESEATPLARPNQLHVSDLADTAEYSVSWFDRLMFSWTNDLLHKGTVRQLNLSDMYRLDRSDMPIPNWKRYLRHRKEGRTLFMTVSLTLAFEITTQVVLAIVRCIIHFAGPFFLQRILRAIEHSNDGLPGAEKNFRKTYLDVFCLLVFSLINSLLGNHALWIGRHIGARIKGILVAELSLKTLRRRGKGTWDEKQSKENEGRDSKDADFSSAATNGRIMTLLGGDLNRIYDVASYLDQLFSTPLSLVIGICYLYRLLGISALIGLSFSLAYTPLVKRMFTRMAVLDKTHKAIGDKRVTMVSELINGIKAVKLFGWETRFVKIVNKLRESQVDYVWKIYTYNMRVSAVTGIGPMIVFIVIFSVYVGVMGNALTAEVAFTSVAVFQIVRGGFDHLPGFLSWAISAFVVLERMGSYLEHKQAQDLDDRVSRTQGTEGGFETEALGFECADLEWEIPASNSGSSRIPQGNSQNESTTTIGNHSDENMPLLATTSPSCSQTSLDTGSSIMSVDRQNSVAKFSLKEINVQFPIGGFTIVAGPTGCGKSSLLSALIGEMTLTRGRILLPTVDFMNIAARDSKYREIIELSGEERAIYDIAYVAQEAWLRNTTIRENILFGEPYDKERYEEVLRVCALKPDLRILPAGDRTEIGERGITLSGGQKQRITLARAVYSSHKILIIDDCLSAVDAHTGMHILKECLVGNTKLMQGRTRILVTHHVTMCLPYVQYIVMMHKGRVTLKGTPAELQGQKSLSKEINKLESSISTTADKTNVSNKREVAASDAKDPKGKSAEDSNTIEDLLSENGDTPKKPSPNNDVNDMKSEDEYNAERQILIDKQKSLGTAADVSLLQGILIKEEKREEGFVKFKVWKMYLLACGTTRFWSLILFFIIVSQCVRVLQDYWIRIWVRSAGDTSSVEKYIVHHSVVYWLGIYTLIGLAGIAWRIAQECVVYTGWAKASKEIHANLLHKIVRAKPRFFDYTPVGRIISRFTRDIGVIDSLTLSTFLGWVSDIVAVLGVFTIIIVVTPSFITVAIALFLVYAGISFYYLNSSREIKRIELNSLAPLMSLVNELIEGISTIRAFGMKQCYLKEVINLVETQNCPYYMFWATNRWLQVRTDFAGAVVGFSSALFVVMSLDWMDAGLAGFVLSYALSFSDHMVHVIHKYGENELNMNATERIMQYMDIDQEAPSESDPQNKPSAIWPSKGDVQIEDLVVEYVPGVPVLHGISLSIEHGQKIGVVGRTGAGKSSISLALLRFMEATKGRIVLDGVDISKIGLEELRSNVTSIPQDPVLFNGTIRFNLDPFDEHPDELLWDALRRTHLVREGNSQTDDENSGDSPAHERMVGIFTSLDAEIKEHGHNISAGQRQLVALARALVRRSRLIVMDEATASVDFDTDNRIQQTIRGPEFANSTLFCIAHRLRTIIDYDKVLVLDNGRVAEYDTPYNLLQNERGIFTSLCKKSGEYSYMVKTVSPER
ncbi:hypothetical protein GGI11_001797 [Coemansia sp. RSA 2049]|nr:hypothetical protein GGI11_001797 [Coemansia sp. RSA 2049]